MFPTFGATYISADISALIKKRRELKQNNPGIVTKLCPAFQTPDGKGESILVVPQTEAEQEFVEVYSKAMRLKQAIWKKKASDMRSRGLNFKDGVKNMEPACDKTISDEKKAQFQEFRKYFCRINGLLSEMAKTMISLPANSN